VYYSLTGSGGGTGPFTLTLSFEPPTPTSANDAFAARPDITAPTYHFDGSIYGATSEPGEPLLNPSSDQTLWWRFVAPEDCILNVGINAPEFSPTIRVYDGNAFSNMVPVNPVHDSFYRLQGGREYSVQMASGYVPGGSFSMDTQFYSLTNDMFSGAIQ